MKAEDWLTQELLRSFFSYTEDEWSNIIASTKIERLGAWEFPDGAESLRKRLENAAALHLMVTFGDRNGLFKKMDAKWKLLIDSANDIFMLRASYINDSHDEFQSLLSSIDIASRKRDILDGYNDFSLLRSAGRDTFLFLLNSIWYEDFYMRVARSTKEIAGNEGDKTISIATGPMVEFVFACASPVFSRIGRDRPFTPNAVSHAIRKHRTAIEKHGREGIPYWAGLMLEKIRLIQQILPLTDWPPMAKSYREAAIKFAI